MQSVEVFLNSSSVEGWQHLVRALNKEGIELSNESKPCDVSVVLSGQHINPFALTGKKILLAYSPEWGDLFYHVFLPVLKHYYDEITDIYGRSVDDIVAIIKKYKGGTGSETSKSRG